MKWPDVEKIRKDLYDAGEHPYVDILIWDWIDEKDIEQPKVAILDGRWDLIKLRNVLNKLFPPKPDGTFE